MTQDPRTYLQYLPEIYSASDAQESDFLERFLDIFQKIFDGVADKELDGRRGIGELLDDPVIGQLFNPRFGFLFPQSDAEIPKLTAEAQAAFQKYVGDNAFDAWLDDFLLWLADWVDIEVPQDLSKDARRELIFRAMRLHRSRGSLDALQSQITLSLKDPEALPVSVRAPKAPEGLQVGKTILLQDHYSTDAPRLGGALPGVFDVIVTLVTATHPKANINAAQLLPGLQRIEQVAENNKPLGSQFRLDIEGAMVIGKRAYLGIDTLLGAPPPS